MEYGGLIPGAKDLYGSEAEETGELTHQYLTFAVAGGEYGIGLRAPVPRDAAHHPVRMRVLDDGIVRH